jgi:hypothetical protein
MAHARTAHSPRAHITACPFARCSGLPQHPIPRIAYMEPPRGLRPRHFTANQHLSPIRDRNPLSGLSDRPVSSQNAIYASISCRNRSSASLYCSVPTSEMLRCHPSSRLSASMPTTAGHDSDRRPWGSSHGIVTGLASVASHRKRRNRPPPGCPIT